MIGFLLLFTYDALAGDTASYNFSSTSIEYNISGEFPQYHDPVRIMDLTGDVLRLYLVENNISEINECYDLSIDISYLSHTSLNDLRREGRFGEQLIEHPNIQGVFFSPEPWEKNETEIWVANSLTKHRRVDLVFGHEVVHYWWQRLCLGKDIKINQEQVADEIEDRLENSIHVGKI